jgi:hypothetical protein
VNSFNFIITYQQRKMLKGAVGMILCKYFHRKMCKQNVNRELALDFLLYFGGWGAKILYHLTYKVLIPLLVGCLLSVGVI